MSRLALSFNTRKALAVQIGEEPARDLVELLNILSMRVEQLERNKVDVTHILPMASEVDPPSTRRAA